MSAIAEFGPRDLSAESISMQGILYDAHRDQGQSKVKVDPEPEWVRKLNEENRYYKDGDQIKRVQRLSPYQTDQTIRDAHEPNGHR